MDGRPSVVRSDETDDEGLAELLEEAETGWYGDAAFFGAMAHCPDVFRNLVSTLESFGRGENVDTELLELMRLKVAEVHQCGYCATVRTLDVREAVARKEGAVFGEIDADELSRREYLAVSLAERLSEDPHRIRDEFFDDLREVFTEAEVVELLLFASLEIGLDRFCIALELQPTADSPYPDDVEYPLSNPRRNAE